MSTYTTYYQHELRKLIDDAINRQAEIMTAGALSDFSAYQRAVGIVMGLRISVELMDEADKIIMEQR